MKTIAITVLVGIVLLSLVGLTAAEDNPDCEPQTEEVLCNTLYDPVCGSDYNTYENLCMMCNAHWWSVNLKQKGIKKLHDGKCTTKEECTPFPKPGICTMDLRPVCGSDEVSHSNKCMFCNEWKKNPDLTINHYGECDQTDQ
ncbi:double-headed protease inhibitor, submandibular gland-like [Gastrophryne carolinensis]